MKIRRRVLISGRVQGVGFRAACRRAALNFHVSGWVRNLPDNRVEAVFEGEAEDVEQMLAWCGRGPTYATVISVEVSEEEPRGENCFLMR